MKLLSKQQVASRSAEIRRQEITEGQELVERVSALRKALADLKQQHIQFIESSKIELARQTTELFGQKEGLKAEVEVLTKVREELQKPLTDKWIELNKNKEQFEKEQKEFYIKSSDLQDKIDKADKLIKQKEISLQKALDAEQRVNQNEIRTEKAKNEAEQTLKDAKANRDEIEKECNERLEQVGKEEQLIKHDKEANENVAKINKDREEELNEREAKINAKFKVLERASKIIKK